MIVLDSSAIVAILSRESGYESLLATVTNADRCALSALTFFETALVYSHANGKLDCKTLLSSSSLPRRKSFRSIKRRSGRA